MRKLLFIFSILIAITFSSCRKDFTFEQSTGGLEFSKSTVYLDTVFTNISSSTYRLKVYNRGSKDIVIPKIQLGKGINSKYRIMVDGMTGDAGAIGKSYTNVELLAKDSLYIFIEVTADVASANPTDFLYTDQIQFSNVSGAPQTVDLVTLIQDAIFIYPDKYSSTSFESINLGVDTTGAPITITGSNLLVNDPVNGNELHWTKGKPYVVYGYALVPDNKTLVIDAGAKVYFHANSGLIVAKNGNIQVNGDFPSDHKPENLTNEVIFQGDRLEPAFSDVPGQWFGILMLSQNTNTINHLTLKNATVGIYCVPLDAINNFYSTKLNITNSQIYNNSNYGLFSLGAQITGENVAINNCGQYCLTCTYGGNYNFTNSTFNNDWSSSKQLAVLISDYFADTDTSGTTTYYANNATNNYHFNNCIMYGSNQVEFYIDRIGTQTFTYSILNSLIKFNNSQLNDTGLYDFNNPIGPYANSCYISKNNTHFTPSFKNPDKNQLWPTVDLSVAPSLMTAMTPTVTLDILGKNRTTDTTIGAYQFIP